MSNCRMSARGYGERMFSVSRLEHGMSIVTGGVSQSRNRQWFFAKKVSSSSFSLVANSSSYEDFLDASNWLSRYMAIKSDPTIGDRYGAMRVQIANVNWDAEPAVPFDKTAIITSAISYGDSATSILYPIAISFSGASREINLEQEVNSSLFSQPLDEQDPAFKYFYPFTSTLSPTVDVDSQVYDSDFAINPDLLIPRVR